GAGPAGLVAALTLLRNGVRVRIIDKEFDYRLGQRGLGLTPRSLELFRFLDVTAVEELARGPHPMRVYKPGTLTPVKTFTLTPYMETTPAFPYFNPVMLGQQTLEAILRSHLEEMSCSVELGTGLRSFEQNEDRVLASIVRKVDGEDYEETVECQWLIGADGARGVTRKLLGLNFIGETRDDVVFISGDIRLSSASIDRQHWHQFSGGATKTLSLRPSDEIGPDGFQFCTRLTYDTQALFDHIRSVTTADIIYNQLVWVSEFRFKPNVRMVEKLGVGRIFIAGGPVHSPTGGQFNLSWKLALVTKNLAPPSLLTTYTTERIPVIAEMLQLSTQLLDKTVKLTADTAQGALQRSERMHMLGVNYRSSPIVIDEYDRGTEYVDAYGPIRASCLVAGDRAPDAPSLVPTVVNRTGPVTVSESIRLFDLFRPSFHTVLLFTTDVAWAVSTVQAIEVDRDVIRWVMVIPQSAPSFTESFPPFDLILHDREGHAYRGYHVEMEDSKVFVVRPDGVLGAIVRGREGLGRYFDVIFNPASH
ncbi:FAD binding domain-containing protein, partial [Phlebopus sp. FC_14]